MFWQSAIRNPQSEMVFAVQCPNDKCKKYQLVEDADRGKLVHCLLCKAAIKVAAAPSNPKPGSRPPAPPPTRPRK